MYMSVSIFCYKKSDLFATKVLRSIFCYEDLVQSMAPKAKAKADAKAENAVATDWLKPFQNHPKTLIS